MCGSTELSSNLGGGDKGALWVWGVEAVGGGSVLKMVMRTLARGGVSLTLGITDQAADRMPTLALPVSRKSKTALARGAKGGCARGDDLGPQQCSTAQTGLLSSAVTLQLAGKGAWLVGDVAIVAKGGAAGADGVVEDLEHGIHE